MKLQRRGGGGVIARVLAKMGAMVRSQGTIYKVVDQSVLLYRSDNLVVTGYMLKSLKGFHHREVRHITGMKVTRGDVGDWGYPLVVAAMYASGLCSIG